MEHERLLVTIRRARVGIRAQETQSAERRFHDGRG